MILKLCWETSCGFIKAILPASKPMLTRALENTSGRSFTFSLSEFCSKICCGTFACLLTKIVWLLFFKFMTNQVSLESFVSEWHPWLPSVRCIKQPRSVLHYFCSLSGLLKLLRRSGRKWDFKGTKWILISLHVPKILATFFHHLLVIDTTSTITPGRWRTEKQIQSFLPNTYKYKLSPMSVIAW